MKKSIVTLLMLILCATLLCSGALAYTSDVIDLRSDYKGATEGILKGSDYPENSHIVDLDEDYLPWMQAAVGDFFTEEYLHQYQVYWKCVAVGFIKPGDDLDLSLVIKEGDSTDAPAEPIVELVGMTSEYLGLPTDYAGRYEGIISGTEYPRNDSIGLEDPYETWMRLEFGSDFDESALREYQLYWKAVEAGVIQPGEDLDLSVVMDTEVYSNGSTLSVGSPLLAAKYHAMRLPTAIICGVLIVVIIAISVVVMFWQSNRRYQKYLARGGATEDAEGNDPQKDDDPFVLTQNITLDIFGNKVPVTVQRDEAGTIFRFAYVLDGRTIDAVGEIRDGDYVVTHDPSGVGKMVIKDIKALLADDAWQK